MNEWRLWVTALALIYGYLFILISLFGLYRSMKSIIRRMTDRSRRTE